MVRRAAWNVRAAGAEARWLGVQGDAGRIGWPSGALIQIDPDRRPSRADRPVRDLARYSPGVEVLRSLPGGSAGGAIKLGPASDFASLATTIVGSEVEVVSLRGECKEATLWYGGLAGPMRRRATVLPWGVSVSGNPEEAMEPSRERAEVGAIVFEPDAAILRAGLTANVARKMGVGRLDSCGEWLVGWSKTNHWDSHLVTPFRVEQVLPLDLRRIRHAVRDTGLSISEIKTRGVGPEWRPERLRRDVRGEGQGDGGATLLILGGRGERGCALVVRRVVGAASGAS
jgi:hypothetical protein